MLVHNPIYQQPDPNPSRPLLKVLENDLSQTIPDVIYIERSNWFNNPHLLNSSIENHENSIKAKQAKINHINDLAWRRYELTLERVSCPFHQSIPLNLINYTSQRQVIKRQSKKLAKTEFSKRKYFINHSLPKPYLVPSIDDIESELQNTFRSIISARKANDCQRREILHHLAKGKKISNQILTICGIEFFYKHQQPNIIAFGDDIADIEPQPTIKRLKRENRQPVGIADFVLIEHSKWQQYDNMNWLYDRLPPHLPLAKTKKEPSNRYSDKSGVCEYPYFTPNRRGIKNYIYCIIFDLDPTNKNGDLVSDNFFKWSDVGLPPPNIIVKNPHKHGSCQYIYFLSAPLRSSEEHASIQQTDWLNRIIKCMTALLNADPAFNGGRSKNPFSSEHDTYVGGAKSYTFQQLSDGCDLIAYEQKQREFGVTGILSDSANIAPPNNKYRYMDTARASNHPKFGIGVFVDSEYWRYGKNGQAFEAIRHRAYLKAYLTPEDLTLFVHNEYIEYQSNFAETMADYDIRASVKSIVKYCIKQFGVGTGKLNKSFKERLKEVSDNKFTYAQRLFSIHQRNRVNIRWQGYADKKHQALAMLKQGFKQADICRELRVDKKTLYRWKKNIKNI